ncbi:MAG: tetratricopeptide repeat protein [Alphaproteobacteria bacterium]|nr:tetratricopeptide repeat protein [Alphaproteobacteria bacterium]
MGGIATRQGRPGVAAEYFTGAVAVEPTNAAAHSNLGSALRNQGKVDEAIACFRRATEIDPDLVETHNNLGHALGSQGKLDEAIACFRRAIEIDPDFAEPHNKMGVAAKSQNKLEEAIACYRRAIEINPDYAEAYNNLGNAFKDRNKPKEAIASYRRAIEIRPDFGEPHCNLASIHTFTPGDPEIELLNQLLARNDVSPDNRTHLHFALGKACDAVGLYDEAFSNYRQGNEEIAKQILFDASDHRKEVTDIKRVFQEWPAGADPGDGDPVPIFVVGMSRSGKSLTESLLSQHEDVYGAGESRAWNTALRTVLDKNAISGPFPTYVESLTDGQIREMGEIYMKEVSRLSPESRFFVDTMPGNYPYVGLIFRALPSARMIHCHRDPVDNCLFIYFQRYRLRLGKHRYSYDLRNIASYYAGYEDVMAHWRKIYGDRILGLPYEETMRNPAQTTTQIFAFCGLGYDPGAIRAAFTTDQIGHWKHYESYLGPLRQALGKRSRQADGPIEASRP